MINSERSESVWILAPVNTFDEVLGGGQIQERIFSKRLFELQSAASILSKLVTSGKSGGKTALARSPRTKLFRVRGA